MSENADKQKSGTTCDRVPFQRWRTAIEDEHWTDPIEQELANTTKKPQDMRIHESATLLVTHGGLELVNPYARVDRESLSLDGFKPSNVV